MYTKCLHPVFLLSQRVKARFCSLIGHIFSEEARPICMESKGLLLGLFLQSSAIQK